MVVLVKRFSFMIEDETDFKISVLLNSAMEERAVIALAGAQGTVLAAERVAHLFGNKMKEVAT